MAQAGWRGEVDVEAGQASYPADSVAAALGEHRPTDEALRLRLMKTFQSAAGWTLDQAWVAEVEGGGEVAINRAHRDAAPAGDLARIAPWHLQRTVRDSGHTRLAYRLDRLSAGYSGEHAVVRVGRQALTWGGGLVFRPMDLFNPFAPDATDTRYKPGADMAYGQWLFDDGSDVQAVVVPRRDPATGRIAAAQASYGLKLHGMPTASTSVDLMWADDQRTSVVGLALDAPLGGWSLHAECLPMRSPGDRVRVSALLSLRAAAQWGKTSVTGFAEWFRNGYGVAGGTATLATLPTPLAGRLARGVLFSIGRDALALGLELQPSPLVTLRPTLLKNLNDGSGEALAQTEISLRDDLQLTAGLQWPFGARGSEHGGVETTPDSGVYAASPQRAFVRLGITF